MNKTNQNTDEELIACKECDLLIRLQPFQAGNKACCPRCGHVISQKVVNAKDRVSALSIGALIFLGFSFPFTFLSFESKGNEKAITLADSAISMFQFDFDFIGILLLLTTIFIPAFFLMNILIVSFSLSIKRSTRLTHYALKSVFHLLDWNMAEIFLIGILVSLVKIASMANVTFGLSFGAYVLFIVLLVATVNSLDRFQIWRWVSKLDESSKSHTNHLLDSQQSIVD